MLKTYPLLSQKFIIKVVKLFHQEKKKRKTKLKMTLIINTSILF